MRRLHSASLNYSPFRWKESGYTIKPAVHSSNPETAPQAPSKQKISPCGTSNGCEQSRQMEEIWQDDLRMGEVNADNGIHPSDEEAGTDEGRVGVDAPLIFKQSGFSERSEVI